MLSIWISHFMQTDRRMKRDYSLVKRLLKTLQIALESSPPISWLLKRHWITANHIFKPDNCHLTQIQSCLLAIYLERKKHSKFFFFLKRMKSLLPFALLLPISSYWHAYLEGLRDLVFSLPTHLILCPSTSAAALVPPARYNLKELEVLWTL